MSNNIYSEGLQIEGDLLINGSSDIYSDLIVTGNIIGNSLTINGDTVLENNVNVNGPTTFENDITVNASDLKIDRYGTLYLQSLSNFGGNDNFFVYHDEDTDKNMLFYTDAIYARTDTAWTNLTIGTSELKIERGNLIVEGSVTIGNKIEIKNWSIGSDVTSTNLGWSTNDWICMVSTNVVGHTETPGATASQKNGTWHVERPNWGSNAGGIDGQAIAIRKELAIQV